MHVIKIINFSNNEQVSHSFVVIKGFVINKGSICCETYNTVTLEILRNNSFLSCGLKEGRFKFLLELSSGLNNLKLVCCCASLTLNLEYVEPTTNCTVLPCYIICNGHDGKFQAPENENNSIESACKRIITCVKLLQCVVAEKLFEQNLGRRTFKLENDCHVFYSKLHCDTARQMEQSDLWVYFAREIINSPLKNDNKKILALLSCTQYQGVFENGGMSHEDVLRQTQAHVALGAGGLAVFGTGCLYTWPENISEVIPRFLNQRKVDAKCFMDDSCYRGTLGSCFSTTLGSVLHELCHTFDLGHTEKGIMGRGFDNIQEVFTLNEANNSSDANKRDFCVYPNINRHTVKNTEINFENDQTYWTKSCAVLLRYHKWINGCLEQKKSVLQCDANTGVVKTTAGIRVIEIRSEAREMVLDSWIFTSKVLKFLFAIPEEALAKYRKQTVVIVVEDNAGNILKDVVTL